MSELEAKVAEIEGHLASTVADRTKLEQECATLADNLATQSNELDAVRAGTAGASCLLAEDEQSFAQQVLGQQIPEDISVTLGDEPVVLTLAQVTQGCDITAFDSCGVWMLTFAYACVYLAFHSINSACVWSML